MRCAWKELLAVLPAWMREEVDVLGKEKLQELRLRINAPPELLLSDGYWRLHGSVQREDLHYCLNAASQYSPWTAASCRWGYLTAPGGHRIGICGEAVVQEGVFTGFRDIRSLCIRVARDVTGIGSAASAAWGSVLILGAPGWGKTTLLRDVSRTLSEKENVAVVDERGELFPEGFAVGRRMDVLSGCPKETGMEMVLRTMGPGYIAVDEITAETDSRALVRCHGCGVRLLATAHAASTQDLYTRKIYRPFMEAGVFQTVLVLNRDRSFRMERMEK